MKQQTLVPKDINTFSNRQTEYWRHVSPQQDLPIAGANETPEGMDLLNELFEEIRGIKEETEQKEFVRKRLMRSPSLIHLLRFLIGVSDKRAYLDLSWEFREADHPEKPTSLCGCPKTDLNAHSLTFFENMMNEEKSSPAVCKKSSEVVTDYFFEKGLGIVLSVFANIPREKRDALLEKTIFPHEAQQSEAKRRGHGAEAEFAKTVEQLGLKILPEGKSENPMTRDLRLNVKTFEISSKSSGDTRSYDMGICDRDGKIKGCVIALIHSSDPGEYGVAKAERVEQYKKEIEQYNKSKKPDERLFLWAMVDGTGFSENKNDTINRILANVHFFVQMRTLFKIGLHLHVLGLCKIKGIWLDTDFYRKEEISDFLKKYLPNGVQYVEQLKDAQKDWKPIKAGLGVLYI